MELQTHVAVAICQDKNVYDAQLDPTRDAVRISPSPRTYPK